MVVPSVSMARLLPLAVRVDPDRSSEYLWRAIAARPPRAAGAVHGSATLETRQHNLVLARLAALVARYDREAAETIFAPVADDALALLNSNSDLIEEAGAILQAAAAYDPRGPGPDRRPARRPRAEARAPGLRAARQGEGPARGRSRSPFPPAPAAGRRFGPRPVRPLARRARRLISSSRIAIEETSMRIGPRRIPQAAALLLALVPLVKASQPAPRFEGATIPDPPGQGQPWTPPETSLPRFLVRASATLFEQGLADPRGGDYRAIEIVVGGVWSNVGESLSTHGWVLPGAPGKRPGSQSRGAGWSTRPSPSVRRPTWRPT